MQFSLLIFGFSTQVSGIPNLDGYGGLSVLQFPCRPIPGVEPVGLDPLVGESRDEEFVHSVEG